MMNHDPRNCRNVNNKSRKHIEMKSSCCGNDILHSLMEAEVCMFLANVFVASSNDNLFSHIAGHEAMPKEQKTTATV